MTFYLSRGIVPYYLLSEFHIGDDGLCNVCRHYEQNWDPSFMLEDLRDFLAYVEDAPVVVAVSGGKDSLAALYRARHVLGLRATGVLVDNGFIPEEVTEQARDRCRSLSVELRVERLKRGEQQTLNARVKNACLSDVSPCDTCSDFIADRVVAVANELGARGLVFGTNYFASWALRPSAIYMHSGLMSINLPYALRVTRADTLATLSVLGATAFKLPGVSTNCRVPGLVQTRLGPVLGHIPELEDLSLEVMVGHLERHEAVHELAMARRGAPAQDR